MKQEPFAYFAQIEPIVELEEVFDSYKKEYIKFYYFKKGSEYFLFLYGMKNQNQKSYSFTEERNITIVKELNKKQRQIRSLRGFFIYALEIIETGEDIELLQTNLLPLFWSRVKNVIKQNRKNVLIDFLFESRVPNDNDQKVLKLQEQVADLQKEFYEFRKDIEINLKL